MRKLIGMMIVMFICFVMTTGSAFAVPPQATDNSLACENASDTGKDNADPDSVVGSCNGDPEPGELAVEEEEGSTDTASTDDTTTTVDCSSPDAMILPECS